MEIHAYRSKDKWSTALYWLGVIFILARNEYPPLMHIGVFILVVAFLYPAFCYFLSRNNEKYRDYFSLKVNDRYIEEGLSTVIKLDEILDITYEDEVLRIATDTGQFKYRLRPGQLEKIVRLKQQVQNINLNSSSLVNQGFDIQYSGVDMVIRINDVNMVQLSRLEQAIQNIVNQVVIEQCKLSFGDSELILEGNIVDKVLNSIHNKLVKPTPGGSAY